MVISSKAFIACLDDHCLIKYYTGNTIAIQQYFKRTVGYNTRFTSSRMPQNICAQDERFTFQIHNLE